MASWGQGYKAKAQGPPKVKGLMRDPHCIRLGPLRAISLDKVNQKQTAPFPTPAGSEESCLGTEREGEKDS